MTPHPAERCFYCGQGNQRKVQPHRFAYIQFEAVSFVDLHGHPACPPSLEEHCVTMIRLRKQRWAREVGL